MNKVPAYDNCSVCGKERKLEKVQGAWVLINHNRWSDREKQMVYCLGSRKPPARKNPGGIIFRPPT